MSELKVEAAEDVKVESKVRESLIALETLLWPWNLANCISQDIELNGKNVKKEEMEAKNGEITNIKEENDEKKVDTKGGGPRTYDNGVLKTTRKVDDKDYKNNSKYDPTVLPETDDAKEIRKQVYIVISSKV
jgi:hypothetical protein